MRFMFDSFILLERLLWVVCMLRVVLFSWVSEATLREGYVSLRWPSWQNSRDTLHLLNYNCQTFQKKKFTAISWVLCQRTQLPIPTLNKLVAVFKYCTLDVFCIYGSCYEFGYELYEHKYYIGWCLIVKCAYVYNWNEYIWLVLARPLSFQYK